MGTDEAVKARCGLVPISDTGATGLEPATSGVTGAGPGPYLA